MNLCLPNHHSEVFQLNSTSVFHPVNVLPAVLLAEWSIWVTNRNIENKILLINYVSYAIVVPGENDNVSQFLTLSFFLLI